MSVGTEELGFIGVGKIGLPIAKRLLNSGYAIRVFDVDKTALGRAVDLGMRPESSAAAVAAAVQTVLVSLPTPEIVKHVVSGPEGVAGARSMKMFIDLSTTGPAVAIAAASALRSSRVTWVDAPVSGGVAGAAAGTLAVMVSCPHEKFESVRLILRNIGKVFHVGEAPGMGQVMKLANNILSATALAATSEVFIMGMKAGLDPNVMVDVLNAGSGRNNATEVKFPKGIIPRKFDLGFTSGLMYKDVKLGIEEGEALGVPMIVGTAVKEAWRRVVDEIGGEKDSTTFIQVLERAAGVVVKPRN